MEIKDGLKRMQEGPPEEHWCKLWARTLESKALSLESSLSYWAHPPLLQLANWDWDLDLRNTVTPLCKQCGLGEPTPMVMSSPYGVSFVGNVLHIQPCTTFPMDYLQECSPPVSHIKKKRKKKWRKISLNRVNRPNDRTAFSIQGFNEFNMTQYIVKKENEENLYENNRRN